MFGSFVTLLRLGGGICHKHVLVSVPSRPVAILKSPSNEPEPGQTVTQTVEGKEIAHR